MEKLLRTTRKNMGDPQKPIGTFKIIQIVAGVAFIVATIFTMWTPSSGSDNRSSAFDLLPLITPNAETSPTPSVQATFRIGLVAGHWGNDPGAVCADGLREVDVNLEIATLVRDQLIRLGYQVDLMEEFDELLSGYKAAALISIHADSCDFINTQATGFKVAPAFATKNPQESERLTACLRQRYQSRTGLPLHSTSVTNDMTRYHAFDEIAGETPAAIIETGFLNLDRQILTNSPELIAQGITDGILCFMRHETIPAITSVPSPLP